jgi:hypothetical protein
MRAIARDLRPVKPSPQPLHLALRMFPLALLVSSVILLAIGPRHDLGILGPLLTWGASAAQFVLAAFVWIAAHESTPAGKVPRDRTCSFIAFTPPAFGTESNDAQNFASRSCNRYRIGCKQPPSSSVALRAICSIHASVGCCVTPPSVTRRVSR